MSAELNAANLQGISPNFKVTLTKESTLSTQADFRVIAQDFHPIPLSEADNYFAHKFYPLDIYSANPDVLAQTGTAGIGWTSGIRCDLSRDTSVTDSPVGGVPLKMYCSGTTDPYTLTYNNTQWNIADAKQGDTWTFSVYAKADQATTGELFIFEANAAGGYNTAPAVGISITTSWQRFSFTRTFTTAAVAIQVRLDGPNSGGAGRTIWWDGIQVEKSATASPFSPGTNKQMERRLRETGSLKFNVRTKSLEVYSAGDWKLTGGSSNAGGLVGSFGVGKGFTVAEGADDTNHSNYTNTAMPTLYEGIRYNDGQSGDETRGATSNTRHPLEYVSSTSSSDFAFHTGHGSPGNVAWPQYYAVKVSEYDYGKVLNRVRWYKHTNAIGNVDVYGTNLDVDRTNFTDTAQYWNHLGRLHFGGSGSGSEGGQRTQNFTNAYGYRWYMLEMIDINSSALAYPQIGTRGGWAMYPLTFDKV